MKSKSFLRAVLSALLTLGMLSSISLAAPPTTAPATAPATKPVPPPLTAEQKAVIAKFAALDPAQPAAKTDLHPYNADGSLNPNFGKPDIGFVNQHEAFMKRKEKPIGILFIGDSITAGWGRAKTVWAAHYGKLDPANFGISGDRTEHVLWRIQQGELDGISPKVVVLMIGTNNSYLPPEKITAGVEAIVNQIHAKLPQSKLLLLGIFPRGPSALDANGKPAATRVKLQAVNAELAKLDDGKQTRYLEIWKQFLTEDGTLSEDIMPDHLHPNEKGYTIWANTMQPVLDEMLK